MRFMLRTLAFTLFIAGLQNFFFAIIVQAAEKRQPEPLFVEVFFNKISAGDHDCFQQEEAYWIPFDLFVKQTGLKGQPNDKGIVSYETSLGQLSFDPRTLTTFEDTRYISFKQLDSSFFVKGRFVQSVFAIALDVPWIPGKRSKKLNKAPAITPDIPAPSSSLSFIRLEPQLSYTFGSKSFKRDILLESGGRFLGGVWDITFEGDPTTTLPPNRYHWTTYNDHLAFRAGTGSSDLYSLVGDMDFTGFQLGWNNKTILSQLDFERYSDSDAFLSIDRSQQRTIEGNAPPASIAELRIEGIVVARQRVGLNGRFVFRNVRMTSDLRKTEVYLYERTLRQKPLTILDYSMSLMNRMLPAHEVLVRTGGGVTGNPLDREGDENYLWTGFGHILYGLSNRMTFETGIQYNPEKSDIELFAGTVLAIGGNFGIGIYGARLKNRYATDLKLQGNGRDWSLSYLGSYSQKDFSQIGREQLVNHSMRFSTGLFKPFDITLFGKYEKNGDANPDKYLLPGLNWYVFPGLILSALPNDDEEYRYEANMTVTSRSDLAVTYEEDIVNADLSYDFGNALQSRALYKHAISTGSSVGSVYFDWNPGGNRYDLIRLGVSRAGKETGYSVAWNKFFNAGLQMSLQYSYNMNNALQLETEETFENLIPPEANQYVALALTWDIGRSGKRFLPINRTAISHTRGGIAGSLKIMNDSKLGSSDINNVNILLNRKKLGQRQVDGSFFVGNLKPGVYALDVDTENLPLELNIENKSTYVEVLNGAVTDVLIPVYAEYAVAGKVIDTGGKAVEDIKVTVTDKNGKAVDSPRSNMFGYYSTKGLRPGTYTISAAGKIQSVTVADKYLYGIDFTIEKTIPAPVLQPFTDSTDNETASPKSKGQTIEEESSATEK